MVTTETGFTSSASQLDHFAVPTNRGRIEAILRTICQHDWRCINGQQPGVTAQGVVSLERSRGERQDQLNLRCRAAEAMDCVLVYAVVPRPALTGSGGSPCARDRAPCGVYRIRWRSRTSRLTETSKPVQTYIETASRPGSVGAAVTDLFAQPDDAHLSMEKRDGLCRPWITTRRHGHRQGGAGHRRAYWTGRHRSSDIWQRVSVFGLLSGCSAMSGLGAGSNPTDGKNIGIDPHHHQLGGLLRDARCGSSMFSFAPDEIAIKVYGLVASIPSQRGDRPYPPDGGSYDRPVRRRSFQLGWWHCAISERAKYIALRTADRCFTLLLAFCS